MNVPDSAKPRLAAKARLKWDELRQKNLLLYPEGLLVLNPTAHAVVALCNGKRTVSEIIQKLTEKYESDAVAGDVRELLSQLTDKGLIVAAISKITDAPGCHGQL